MNILKQDYVNTYSKNFMAYLLMHDVPVELKKDEDGKIYGFIGKDYLGRYAEIRKKYKEDSSLRRFLDTFKDMNIKISEMRKS